MATRIPKFLQNPQNIRDRWELVCWAVWTRQKRRHPERFYKSGRDMQWTDDSLTIACNKAYEALYDLGWRSTELTTEGKV